MRLRKVKFQLTLFWTKVSQVMWFNCSAVWNNTEDALRLFQRVAYTPVFAVGLPLNVLALWLFFRIHQWTATHVYMFNLLLADFLLLLFLPFRIFQTFCPINPTGLCTFLICVHFSNMYVSIFTITAISVHRFVALRFPMLIRGLETQRKTMAVVVCAVIWLTIMLLCGIFHPNMYPRELRTCYELKGRTKLSFLLVLEIVGYLLPTATILTCSTQAIYAVLKSTEELESKVVVERKRAVAIIVANTVIFFVCFTPVHVGFLLRYLYPEGSPQARVIHIFYEVSEWIATTNCCLDAIGYYLLLKKVFKANR
ncbi:G-protein coupled receptor 55-like isoform X1 [Hoplias malabaricus]|uniref:G-protein coupled receptor 55-like isoform X1 n=2 Tax=Hoplias malabaricus TaxID=27720 RepID=UPI003461C4A4